MGFGPCHEVGRWTRVGRGGFRGLGFGLLGVIRVLGFWVGFGLFFGGFRV